jgi:8-oxo-dGTP diphosphatase
MMIDVTAAIWIESGRVLIARRPPGASYAGLWEFPGGKAQHGESLEECLKREIKEELGIHVQVGPFFGESIYTDGNKTIRLLAYRVGSANGIPAANDHAELSWVKMGDLGRYRFCPADLPFVEKLRKMV